MTRCFVIMPFSGTTPRRTERYWTQFFEGFIKPAVEGAGFRCIRSTAEPRNIVSGILDELLNTDVVLAVLTDRNPNVWYELGVRHSLRDGTIMVIQKGQKIPFDVSHFGVITYDDRNPKLFRSHLKRFLRRLQEPTSPDSPVLKHLATATQNLVRAATSIPQSPITFENALTDAQEHVFVVGQNLNSLVTNPHLKTALASTLQSKRISVWVLVVDPKKRHVPRAYNSVIGPTFSVDLAHATRGFASWNRLYASGKKHVLGTFEARASERVGTVSLTFVDPEKPWAKMLLTPVSWLRNYLKSSSRCWRRYHSSPQANWMMPR